MLDLIYACPTWLVGAAFVGVGVAFALACLFAVRRTSFLAGRNRHADLIGLTVTNVAVFYGVLLAFLTVAVWQDHSDASQTANREAALVGNLYHDMAGLTPPLADDLQRHTRTYLRNIVAVEWPMQARGRIPSATRISLVDLHRHVAALSPSTLGDAVVMADMLRVLNDIDAARAARLEALGGHVPPLIWTLLVLMSLLTVGLAACFPSESVAVHGVMLGGIVVSAALTMLMIVELDDPFRGAVSVSAAPYREVLAQMLGARTWQTSQTAPVNLVHHGVPGR